MSKLIVSPLILAIAVASVIAGVLVLLTSVAPPASAEPEAADVVLSAPAADGSLTGRGCSERSWPHYDRGCHFDLRPSGDTVRTVRIVDLEIRRAPGRAGEVVAAGRRP